MTGPMTERLNAALQGRYRIERELGQGGMATVYLAEDVKHDRQVAVKVLKPELAAVIGAERFVAEIKTTAALQHPHILPLFDSGEADSFLYYVMPYVEGETLRDRLDRERQLAVDDALSITKDVADALHYAHRQGVIHRDIKPENILLHEGRPVVADFGIAVAISAAGGGRMTETGLSLGTPHYMSPEQATAERDLTVRSDIYSVACVLYEMLAGDPPHTGPSAQAILVRILTESPRPVSDTRASVPPHVAAVLAKALEKLPADRFESAAEFREALDRTDFTYRPTERRMEGSGAEVSGSAGAAGPGSEGAGGAGRGARGRRLLPWAIALAAVAAAGMTVLLPSSTGPGPIRLDLRLGGIEVPSSQSVAISPDGSILAVAGERDGEEAIFVRRLSEADWRALPGTGSGEYPTFSPDGEWLLFQKEDNDALVRTSITGGGTLTLVEEDGVQPYDPHWGADGSIVFTGPQGLHRASAGGGEVELLSTSLNGRNPFMLPDGSGVLAATFGGGVHYYDLEADSSWQLIPSATHPVYLESGHILYVVAGSGLFAAPFDLESGSVTGPPRPVLDQVASTANRRAYAVASNGTMVFLRGESNAADGDNRFVLFDRAGNGDTLAVRTGDLGSPRFSPDGRRIAYVLSEDGGSNVHTFDLLTGEPRQITFQRNASVPVWSPDGSRIAYTAQGETGALDLFVKPSDNSGPERALRGGEGWRAADDWPADTLLVIREGTGDSDLVLLRLDGGGDSVPATPYLRADWNEYAFDLAPQGDLAALVSHEAGAADVWIRTFPDPVGKWRVSDSGGAEPRWSPDGRMLYYWRGAEIDTLLAVTVERDPIRMIGPEPVFAVDASGISNWDLHPDGDRFLVTVFDRPQTDGSEESEGPEPGYVVVLNWLDELRELLDDG